MDDSFHLHGVDRLHVFDHRHGVDLQHVSDPPIDVDLPHDAHLRDVLPRDVLQIRFSGKDHQGLMVFGGAHRPFEPDFRLMQVSSSKYHPPIHELS